MAPSPFPAVEVAVAPFPCLAVVVAVAPFPCLAVVAGVGQLASTAMVEEEVPLEELLSQVVEAEGQPSSAWKPGVSSVEAKVLAVELSWQVGLAQEQVVPEHESQEVVSLTLRWMAWFWRGTLEVEG